MKTLNEIITEALAAETPTREQSIIRATHWHALSLGRERAESRIRARLATLPAHRYHRVQADTVAHVLADNPCAVKPPVCPDYDEMGAWDF
jgi:hypothetical protein